MSRPVVSPRDDFSSTLAFDLISAWDFHEPFKGPLLGPWAAQPVPAEKRFRLLTETILNFSLRKRKPDWSCFVDVDDHGRPTCILLEDGLLSQETPISWTPRSVKIGSKRIFFASKVAGDALVVTLTEMAADMFAIEPKSNSSHRPVYREELALEGRPPA